MDYRRHFTAHRIAKSYVSDDAITEEGVDPVPGAVKLTVTPLTGLPPASLTVACSGVLNAVLVVVFWGVPPVATILAGLPALLVRLKLAEVPTPETLAVTE